MKETMNAIMGAHERNDELNHGRSSKSKMSAIMALMKQTMNAIMGVSSKSNMRSMKGTYVGNDERNHWRTMKK